MIAALPGWHYTHAQGSGSPLLEQTAGFEPANPKYPTELHPPSFRLQMSPLGHIVERCGESCHVDARRRAAR